MVQHVVLVALDSVGATTAQEARVHDIIATTLAKMDDFKRKVISGEIVVPNYIELAADATEMGKPPIARPAAK